MIENRTTCLLIPPVVIVVWKGCNESKTPTTSVIRVRGCHSRRAFSVLVRLKQTLTGSIEWFKICILWNNNVSKIIQRNNFKFMKTYVEVFSRYLIHNGLVEEGNAFWSPHGPQTTLWWKHAKIPYNVDMSFLNMMSNLVPSGRCYNSVDVWKLQIYV